MFRSVELNSVPTSLSLNFKPFPNHIQIQVQQIIVLKHIRAENYTKALQCWKEQIENLCSTKTVTIFEISGNFYLERVDSLEVLCDACRHAIQ